MFDRHNSNQNPEILSESLNACRSGLKAVLVFSFFINLLMLAAPLYMLQVFDRVISSGNTDTLAYLTLITLLAIATLSGLEMIRSRVLVKLGTWLDERLSQAAYGSSVSLASRSQGECSAQGLRDVATLRNFLSGSAIFPFMDAPWLPLFLGIIFLLHPVLGWMATAGAVVLFLLAVINNAITGKPLQESSAASIRAMKQAESSIQNADVVVAMGMMDNLNRRWRELQSRALERLARASELSSSIAAGSKFIRQALQVLIMGAGAWLVLGAELTPGGMVAGSILLGRALAPVDQAIGAWKSAIAARSAYLRIRELLSAAPADQGRLPLPHPEGRLRVEKLMFSHSPDAEPVLRGLSFDVGPGEILGIIGPTASGKSTLARLLVGTSRPDIGHVRIDGADMCNWNPGQRGGFLGYLPQEVELFEGTVSENIARMGEVDPAAVVSAAKAANVHEVILALPEGYETNIGEKGTVLSGGQRQRVAMARALYGEPSLVVLDEPNASLDLVGDGALLKSMRALKARNATTVIVTHRPSILKNADKVLVLYPGGHYEFGLYQQMIGKATGEKILASTESLEEACHEAAN